MPTDGIFANATYEGNDNGLCEAGEACVQNKNIGQYQGHGVIIRDVGNDFGTAQMYKYPTNGFP
jgi:hypothetical protein